MFLKMLLIFTSLFRETSSFAFNRHYHNSVIHNTYKRAATIAQLLHHHTVKSRSRLFSTSTIKNENSIDSNSESNRDSFYITTPIYYVNGQPHLGHAYTSIASDVIARYQRYNSKQVFFLTGTDEHGQKVEQSALAANQSPLEFADTVSASFQKLTKVLDCSNNDFIRTTQERHKETVSYLWKKLEANNQIYLGAYEGT